MLDRDVGGVTFPAERFAETVHLWNGIPIIYAGPHPDLDAYDLDPEAELARIAGRVIGQVQNARVETAGHPRLMADLSWTDPEVEALCQAGTLSISTAFRGRVANAELTAPPAPHHLLVFEEVAGVSMPRDPGATILNQVTMDIANAGRELSAANVARLKTLLDAITGAVEGLGQMLAGKVPDEKVANQDEPAATTEDQADPVQTTETQDMTADEVEALTNSVAEKDAALTQKDQEIANMREKLAAFEQAEKDATWAGIKNRLPVGWTAKPEDETALRTQFETMPAAFINKVMDMPKPSAKPEEGVEFVNQEAADSIAITRELRAASGRL